MLVGELAGVYPDVMAVTQQEIIGRDLLAQSYYSTSWEKLGVEYDEAAAQRVVAACPEELRRPTDFHEGIRREARAVSDACKTAAIELMQPLVDRLFVSELVRTRWSLFGINYYEIGDVLPFHQDLNNPEIKTTIIASLVGTRLFKLRGIHRPLLLIPQDILLLDGGANPWHYAECIEGPSVSVVADVPELLY